MKDIIESRYNIKINAIIKITNKSYKLMCEEGNFVLKYHNDQTLETIFSRLSMINNDVFLLPIKSYNGNYIETFQNLYFAIYPFVFVQC